MITRQEYIALHTENTYLRERIADLEAQLEDNCKPQMEAPVEDTQPSQDEPERNW